MKIKLVDKDFNVHSRLLDCSRCHGLKESWRVIGSFLVYLSILVALPDRLRQSPAYVGRAGEVLPGCSSSERVGQDIQGSFSVLFLAFTAKGSMCWSFLVTGAHGRW